MNTAFLSLSLTVFPGHLLRSCIPEITVQNVLIVLTNVLIRYPQKVSVYMFLKHMAEFVHSFNQYLLNTYYVQVLSGSYKFGESFPLGPHSLVKADTGKPGMAMRYRKGWDRVRFTQGAIGAHE